MSIPFTINQYVALIRAAFAASSQSAAFTPALAMGHNAPGDSNYGNLPVFTNRAYFVPQNFYKPDMSGVLPASSEDPTTGLPTASFALKLAVSPATTDPQFLGQWVVVYSAPAILTITNSSQGNTFVTNSHTFANGVGTLVLTFSSNGGSLVLFCSGGVTALNPMMPADAAKYLSNPASVGLFTDVYLRTVAPYSYIRFMDWTGVNGDYIQTNPSNGAFVTWTYDVVPWSARITPSNFFTNFIGGYNAGNQSGYPIEWQVALCNQAGKDGWFNLFESTTDDYITQFGTLLATTLNPGRIAMVELGNERWNTASGFYVYRRAGYMAMTTTLAYGSATTGITEWLKPIPTYVVSFQSDGVTVGGVAGTATATVVFSAPHGASSGNYPVLRGMLTGYTNFAPTATTTLTVVDSMTITYTCTRAAADASPLAGSTVFANTGFLALNGADSLFGPARTYISSIYQMSQNWHWRRAFQMAQLLKAAFVAAGRSASDCQPVLALMAGSAYYTNTESLEAYYAALFPGVAISSVFAAVACGGYLSVSQSNAPSFSFTGTNAGPITVDDTYAQMAQVAAVGYGANAWTCYAAWAKSQGIQAFGYEVGTDTYGSGGLTTTQIANRTTLNGDARMEGLVSSWLKWMQVVGFSRIGWYQCGAGTYDNTGCFNLGNTAAQIDYTTPTANLSPKFAGILDALQPFASPQTWHAFPCTLSGYDLLGNEGVKIPNPAVWPALNGTNLYAAQSSYTGPSGDGQVWTVWSESQQPATLTLVGDYNVAAAQTISVAVLGTSSTGSMTVSANAGTAVTLGTCALTLQPGLNYVFVRSPTRSSQTFIRSVQFS